MIIPPLYLDLPAILAKLQHLSTELAFRARDGVPITREVVEMADLLCILVGATPVKVEDTFDATSFLQNLWVATMKGLEPKW